MDFLDVGIGTLRWPTFNVADIGGQLRGDRPGHLALARRQPPGPARNRLGRLRPPEGPRDISRCSSESTERLDRFLADQLALSRTQAARLVADKRVTVNGRHRPRLPARWPAATSSVVTLPDLEPPRQLLPAAFRLTVVYEDEHLAVIDKPAGLVVHPAPGTGTTPW